MIKKIICLEGPQGSGTEETFVKATALMLNLGFLSLHVSL